MTIRYSHEETPVYATAALDSRTDSEIDFQAYVTAKEILSSERAERTQQAQAPIFAPAAPVQPPPAEALVLVHDDGAAAASVSHYVQTPQPPPIVAAAPVPVRVIGPAGAGATGAAASRADRAFLYPELRNMKRRRNKQALTAGVVIGVAGAIMVGPLLAVPIGVMVGLGAKRKLKRNEYRYMKRCDEQRLRSEMTQEH